MAVPLTKTLSTLLALNLCFLPLLPFICALSTVAISETSNQTLIICALTHSSGYQQHSYLNCTSFHRGNRIHTPKNDSFSGIVAGNGFVCALIRRSPSSSVLGCWRFSSANDIYYKRIHRRAPVRELEAGNTHICGLMKETNRLECWQWREFNSSLSQHISFSTIAVGEGFVCGLTSEFGNIKCLQGQKANENGGSVVGLEPSGNYSVIAAGFRHACAISTEGNLECWGKTGNDNYKPRGEHFTSLAMGESRSCAIRRNGTVVCWGESNFSLPERLRSTYFVAIQAKQSVFCGIVLSNYSLFCWGNDYLDSSDPVVFNDVVPGACVSECPPCSRPLPGYGSFCGQGLMICEPFVGSSPTTPPPPRTRQGGDWNEKTVAFLVVGCVGSLSLLVVCCFLLCKHCKVKKGSSRVHDSGRLDEEETPPPPPPTTGPVLKKRLSQLLSMGANGSNLEEFPLQILHQATDNFSDGHKIGTGSYGSVYHATLADGRKVAIKRAETSASSSHVVGVGAGTTKRQEDINVMKDNAFLNELEFLSRLNHKNLVRLLGYCEDSNERILVYEYMKNGTLHDHLHKLKKSSLSPLMLSWSERIKVALDAARGIEYLHVYAVPPIIHRDIKSSNILLDDTWTAKVSDFGLSLMMGPKDEEEHKHKDEDEDEDEPEPHLSLMPGGTAGTLGYMDPEYFRLQTLTSKSDVYSFGVVLLELLSGYKAIHRNENGVPRNVVDLVASYIVRDEIHRILDANVPPPTPFEIEAVAYVGYIAVDCVTLPGRDRPTMTEIVNSLERALAACLASPPLSRSTTGSSM
ncbi:Serine/threonine-protein kinase-like protein [Actinidia chinensis var. chinensis]|uniref:Serine/threonine-protein kinase-like protein n=1 Tax=Actinidia chinensis var. chinensis TaxID=1590841 RepID=A0A2R6R2G1_ACTCC|nr:Serine/threonine-protein kinase-like protein [Actinidia chinensis var. chinensis]